ncbi:MAG: deoxyribose-phosphate aldolase [Microbacteriaceae bacterium]|nr:deoxyribose-phosphate aldolase [Microbacteriaceae bacterium]
MTDLTEQDFERLRALRAFSPDAVSRALANRPRRAAMPDDGRLFIVAADHPARGALGVRSNPSAMADRYELLRRLGAALDNPSVDGVLGTPDILDDLASLGQLDGKLAVGSMNRGGLRGATFEMDDRFTAYDLESDSIDGLDFAKLLLRVDLADAGSAATLESAAHAVSRAARARLPIMIEPFMSRRVDGRIVNDLDADSVMLSMAISAGLGNTSAYSWLKLPVVDEMERVMAATTLPTLLLGGDPDDSPDETYASWENALALPGVRGLVVGRTLLYPPDDDVETAVATAARLVHTSALDTQRTR